MTALAQHLVDSGLAGSVATPVASCVNNCRRLVAGDPDYTFGLSDWRHATYDDAVAALAACGVTLVGDGAGAEDPGTTAFVDAAGAVAAVDSHRGVLAGLAAAGARVLLATGHAFALLSHYSALARALESAGCTVLQPLEGQRDRLHTPDGEPCAIRYFDGVGTLVAHGTMLHTHRPDYMEAMLEELGGPDHVDAVIGDHGFAGAAVEAGIRTLSIADVNDPALPLAQATGKTDSVLVIDDGLVPSAYEPVSAAMVSGFSPPPRGRSGG